MIVVGHDELRPKPLRYDRGGIAQLSERHFRVESPQLLIAFVKIGGIQPDNVTIVRVVIEEYRKVVPVGVENQRVRWSVLLEPFTGSLETIRAVFTANVERSLNYIEDHHGNQKRRRRRSGDCHNQLIAC